MERENMLGENTGLEQLNLISKDVQASYTEKIGNIIPEVLTESCDVNGQLKKMIDFDKLKDCLGGHQEQQSERYEFTWVGKREAVANAGRPTTKTLIPDMEESVEFENSRNIFISGDNLEVLKILQESYFNKVDMIYIDPPYNTGNEFVYSDKFKKSESELNQEARLIDDEGRLAIGMTKNEKNSARYHSDWLSMMYPRLRLARNILKESGIIFISIDDNEQGNIRHLCNEIFGEENFIAQVIVDATPKNDPLLIATSHEYCLVYAKNKEVAKQLEWGCIHPLNEKLRSLVRGLPYKEGEAVLKEYYEKNKLKDDNISNYKFVDEQGIYRVGPIDDPQGNGPKDIRLNPLTKTPLKTPSGGWRCSLETWKQWECEKLIEFPTDNEKLPAKKTYLDANKLEVGRSVMKIQTRSSTSYLKVLFDNTEVFSFPKPMELVKEFLRLMNNKEALVLDFFAGSSTTADAVMQLNLEDNGQREYIMVQIEEELDTLKAGLKGKQKRIVENAIQFLDKIPEKTIAKLSRERIIRAANKIKETFPERSKRHDLGFKAFKVASSNYKNVAATPSETTQSNLFDSVSNIKPDRTPLDLLYQVILSWGIELSIKIESMQIESNTVYNVGDGLLLACFDEAISESTIRQMATQQPSMATFRDDAFGRSADKINLGEIFKELSPETKVKVI